MNCSFFFERDDLFWNFGIWVFIIGGSFDFSFWVGVFFTFFYLQHFFITILGGLGTMQLVDYVVAFLYLFLDLVWSVYDSYICVFLAGGWGCVYVCFNSIHSPPVFLLRVGYDIRLAWGFMARNTRRHSLCCGSTEELLPTPEVD